MSQNSQAFDDRAEDEFEEWTVCEACGGEGVVGHDCGEDCCACLNPIDNVDCQICDGQGGWNPPELAPAVGDA